MAQDPSISLDLSDSSLTPLPFSHLNATLVSRGYLANPLSVGDLAGSELEKLANVLQALLSQREEDINVRSSLAAANRTLSNKLDRAERFLEAQNTATVDAQRREEAAKAKVNSMTAALQAERTTLRQTSEALSKARRDLVVVRVSAAQARIAAERASERVRERLAESTTGSLRTNVPSVFVLDSALQSASQGGALRTLTHTHRGDDMAVTQIADLEDKRRSLEDVNQAMRRLATDAVNAVNEAVSALREASWEEKVESVDHDVTRSALSSSSSGSLGNSSGPRAPPPRPIAIGPLYQRDLFPATFPLLTTHGISATSAHPATRALGMAMTALSCEVQELGRLREERGWRARDDRRRAKEEEKERIWKDKCEREERERQVSADGCGWVSHAALLEPVAESKKSLAHRPHSDPAPSAKAETTSSLRAQVLTLTHSLEALQTALEERDAALEASRRAEMDARSLVEDYLQRAEQAEQVLSTRLHGKHEVATGEFQVGSISHVEPSVPPEELRTARAEAEEARQQYVELSRVLEAERETLRRERQAMKSDRERLASEREKVTGERQSLQDELDSLARTLKEARMSASSSPGPSKRRKAPQRTMAAAPPSDSADEQPPRLRRTALEQPAVLGPLSSEWVLEENLFEADSSAGNIARGMLLSNSASEREANPRINTLPPLTDADDASTRKRERLEQAGEGVSAKRRAGQPSSQGTAPRSRTATSSSSASGGPTRAASSSSVASARAADRTKAAASKGAHSRTARIAPRPAAVIPAHKASNPTLPSVAPLKRPLGENTGRKVPPPGSSSSAVVRNGSSESAQQRLARERRSQPAARSMTGSSRT